MHLNRERVEARLNDISRSVARLRELRHMSKEAFLADEDSQDIARSRLLTALEAALNICYHVAAKKLYQAPENYAECFHLLARNRLIPHELGSRLADAAKFRNRLVHLYWDIDYSMVHDFLKGGLSDLEQFCSEAAGWF